MTTATHCQCADWIARQLLPTWELFPFVTNY